jgi:hypothetical protein
MSRRNDRNARASSAVMIEPVDHGADGPAALARRVVEVPTDIAGVSCRQVVEPGPLAGLRLEQRQADAAAELARLWRAALPGREAPMGYAGGGRSGRHLSPEEEREAGEAARLYRDALDACQWAVGVRGVIALETCIIHHQQARLSSHLPRALTALADHFGVL